MDIKLNCRACMKPLPKNSTLLWNIENIKNLFTDCTNLKFEDDFLPKYLCDICHRKCTEWKLFLKQCEDSQNKFYEILNNEIRKHKKPSNVIDMCETIILDDISDKEDEDDDDKMEVDEIPDPIKIIVKRNGTIGSISASKEIIKCKTCNSMFVNSETYETHYKNTHRKKSSSHQLANNQLKVKKMFKCKECRQMFDDLTVYEDHYNNLHSILCEVCHYKFKSFGDCFEHQIKDHKVDILTEIFKCKICSIGFHKTLEYREHMKVHKLEEQSLTSFVCNTCSKEFKSRASLKVHMGTHSEFNNNLCESCGKSFSSATYLSEHILLIHTLEANLQCHLCPHKFKTQKKFDKHIKLHSAEKKIQCEFCPIKFKTRNTYNNHRMTHTGERKYHCRICNHGFIQHHQLKVHMNTH